MEAEENIKSFPEVLAVAPHSIELSEPVHSNNNNNHLPITPTISFASPPKIEQPSFCIESTSFLPAADTNTISTTTTTTISNEDEIEGPQITIDPRSLLEVADKFHRYGKNLRLYFKEYNLLFPFHITSNYHTFQDKLNSYQPFFDWLDSSNQRPPEIPDCNYDLLDHDTVEYLTEENDRMKYKYFINSDGLLQNILTGHLLTTSSKGDMFVLKNKCFYICEKKTKTIPRFHHSSFFGGDSVNAAGILIVENGKLKTIFPHSGHYRPEDKHLLWLLEFLSIQNHLNIQEIQVDAQRVFKVSRHSNTDSKENNGPKAKKMDCLYLLDGQSVLFFLRHKYQAQVLGICDDILNFPKELLHHQPEPIVTISFVLVLPTPPPSPPLPLPLPADQQQVDVEENTSEQADRSFTPLTRSTTTFPADPRQQQQQQQSNYSSNNNSHKNSQNNSNSDSPAILATNPATPLCPSPQRSTKTRAMNITGIAGLSGLTIDTANPLAPTNHNHNNNHQHNSSSSNYYEIPMSCPVYAQHHHPNYPHQQQQPQQENYGAFLSPSAFMVSHAQSSDQPSHHPHTMHSSMTWTPPSSSSSFPLTAGSKKSQGFSYYSRIPRRQRSNSMKNTDEWQKERDIHMLLSESPVPSAIDRKRIDGNSSTSSERRASLPSLSTSIAMENQQTKPSSSKAPAPPLFPSPAPSQTQTPPLPLPLPLPMPLPLPLALPQQSSVVQKSDLSRLLQEDSADCSLYSTTNDNTSRDQPDSHPTNSSIGSDKQQLTSRKADQPQPQAEQQQHQALACVTEESNESSFSHQSVSAPLSLENNRHPTKNLPDGDENEGEGEGEDGKEVDDQLVYHDIFQEEGALPHPPPAHAAHCHASQDQLSPSIQAYHTLSDKLLTLQQQQQQQQQQAQTSFPASPPVLVAPDSSSAGLLTGADATIATTSSSEEKSPSSSSLLPLPLIVQSSFSRATSAANLSLLASSSSPVLHS